MTDRIKHTVFTLDEESCTGCGSCAAACPIHILTIIENLCSMTDSLLCLECGSCVRACPQQAITVTAGTAPAGESPAAQKQESAAITFTPVLDTIKCLTEQAFSPGRVMTCNGMDLTDLDSIETPEARGFAHCYTAEKILKMYYSRFVFFDQMCVEVCGIIPDREYDLPVFMFDWSESADGIFYVCDFFPTDDPGRNPAYLERYLYTPLEALYNQHGTIPGLKPSPLHWVRAVRSPYMICGTVEKTPRQHIGRLLNVTIDYLTAWIKLWEQAVPQDTGSAYMQLVSARRRSLHELYRENDPGIGSLNKFIGEDRGRRVLELILPE